jgi:CBS domain-containing protein
MAGGVSDNCLTPDPPHLTPMTEIVDASELMRRLRLRSLEVSNGERVVGTVTSAAIVRHAARAERTRLVGSIMTPTSEAMRRWRSKSATSRPAARSATEPRRGATVRLDGRPRQPV